MTMLRRLEPLALLLVMLVALNWAVDALFEWNAIHEVFGSGTARDVFYVVAGAAALLFVPRLMEDAHVGGRSMHPRGT
jgi:uncharacterized membrane protein YuzA (DUF378 family)